MFTPVSWNLDTMFSPYLFKIKMDDKSKMGCFTMVQSFPLRFERVQMIRIIRRAITKKQKHSENVQNRLDNSDFFSRRFLKMSATPPLGSNSEIFDFQNILVAACPLGQTS